MHLLQLKKSTHPELSWQTLEKRSGVHRGNLLKIARGERGWDVKTGAALREKLGIDLNEQTRVYVERQKEIEQAAVELILAIVHAVAGADGKGRDLQ